MDIYINQPVGVVMKVITMRKDKVLEIAEHLGCNGEELWSELQKMMKLSGRNAEAKQSLIEYLQKDTDERLFQAITNWSGIAYIGAASTPSGDNFQNLWHREIEISNRD